MSHRVATPGCAAFLAACFFFCVPACAAPLDPHAELATFELVDPRLTVDLVAAEPDVESPVAICWDDAWRMYVAEMRDYPTGPAAGRIRQLLDRDGDGRYESSRVFAEGLAFPSGVLWTSQGLLVTSAPDIWLLTDRDGDGVADERRVVLTGFAEGNQQLRVNGLTWGIDNWIYGANGRSDGAVHHPDDPAKLAISIRGQDFRFRLDGSFALVAGQSQFGQAHDDWGERFLSWNTIAIRHALLDYGEVQRNPRLAALAVRNIAAADDTGQIFPIAPRPLQFNRESALFYNALCGLTIYRGDALPDEYRGNAFVGESLSSVVHRRVLEPQGPTFVSRRGESGCEFLAARDGWFHPVFCTTGPDGALYVVDFYRRFVEHPQFVPESQRGSVDWREGAPRGRIWRIRPRDGWRPPHAENLAEVESAAIVELLSHSNGWQRDTAQRLLVDRRDRGVLAELRQLVAKGKPVAAGHALATLDALGVLDADLLADVSQRGEPQLERLTVKLLAPRLATESTWLAWLEQTGNSTDVALRFTVLRAVAASESPKAVKFLTSLLRTEVAAGRIDEWTALAAACLTPQAAAQVLRDISTGTDLWSSTDREQLRLLRALCAQAGRAEGPQASWCIAQVLGDSGDNEPLRNGGLAALAGLAEGVSLDGRTLVEIVGDRRPYLAARAIPTALDATAGAEVRGLSLEILRSLGDAASARSLMPLLGGSAEGQVAAAAAQTFAALCDESLAAEVFCQWNALSLVARQALLRSAGSSPQITRALVSALAEGQVLPPELDPQERAWLIAWPEKETAARAKQALAAVVDESREAALARYSAALSLSGDPARGGKLFRQHCATCHTLLGVGTRIGPELSSVAARSGNQLLVDLLDPSRQLSPDFMNYSVQTSDGRIFAGLLVSDTQASITLRRGDGLEDTVRRADIEALQATGKSLMPDGLEQRLSVADVADILALLRAPRTEHVRP
ncbi:MAG: c-type cytochrome [Pirellulales bacterium]|nr:c-type cytochrome [Pirellulales bacterium]